MYHSFKQPNQAVKVKGNFMKQICIIMNDANSSIHFHSQKQ